MIKTPTKILTLNAKMQSLFSKLKHFDQLNLSETQSAISD